MKFQYNDYNKNIQALMDKVNWEQTSVGPIDSWSIELKVIMSTMFSSVQPSCLYWGDDLTFFYNEPLIPIMGDGKHPKVFAMSGQSAHADVWDMIGDQINKCYTTGECFLNEDAPVPKYTKSGPEETFFTFSYSPIYCVNNEKIAGVFCSVTETTDQVLNLREEKRLNNIKSSFIANMSHEIRTPLGVVMGYAELLRSPGLSPIHIKSYSEAIIKNSEQLKHIIDNILDFSKIEAEEAKVEVLAVETSTIVEEVFSSMMVKAQEKGLMLDYHISENTPHLIGTDPTRLKQILMNLLSNSIKFTTTGGCKLSISYIENENKKGGRIIFDIQDSGIGLEPKQLTELFKPFSQVDESMTRRFGGTGLGLVISKKLANLLGGDIEITKSIPNVGTTFRVAIEDLEYEEVHQKEVKKIDKSYYEILRNKCVLVVDDAPENLNLMWQVLSPLGVDIITANNGKDGVDLAIKQKPDIVLMDVQMPIMDGYTATASLRSKNFRGIIVAVSAHAQKEASDEAYRFGADAYIAKPFKVDELLSKLSSFFK